MLNFRKAIKEDIAKIAEIYSDIHKGEEEGKSSIGWIRDVYPTEETAENALKRGDMFVLEVNNKVIGAAIINQMQVPEYKDGCWKHEADGNEVMVLHTLVISPTFSGNGYGKSFVNFYEKYALRKGCRYLRMDTNAKNVKARAMYKSLGYSEAGIVKCIFNGIPDVGLVLLEKKL